MNISVTTIYRTGYSALAWTVLVLVAGGCFGAPLQEDPSDVNSPPHISEDFVDPAGDVVQVQSDQTVALSVEMLLDPDDEDRLYYAFVGERSGLIEQAVVHRRPTPDRYRDLFVRFDGVSLELDPCDQRLGDEDDELIRLHVTDRPFERLTDAGVETGEDAFLTTRRWLLRFGPQICE